MPAQLSLVPPSSSLHSTFEEHGWGRHVEVMEMSSTKTPLVALRTLSPVLKKNFS
jgi:hypothetical protein